MVRLSRQMCGTNDVHARRNHVTFKPQVRVDIANSRQKVIFIWINLDGMHFTACLRMLSVRRVGRANAGDGRRKAHEKIRQCSQHAQAFSSSTTRLLMHSSWVSGASAAVGRVVTSSLILNRPCAAVSRSVSVLRIMVTRAAAARPLTSTAQPHAGAMDQMVTRTSQPCVSSSWMATRGR